jgi:hypothetical protein
MVGGIIADSRATSPGIRTQPRRCCKYDADRVKTLVSAVPVISIRLDVLSEFSEPGIRFGKICPMTLDNVLDLIR